MKTKLILLVAAGLVASCRNYLDEIPTAQITTVNFYRTDRDITEAVNSVYGQLTANWQERMHMLSELRADHIQAGPQASNAGRIVPFDLLTYDNLNGDILNTWSTFYTAINNANTVVERAPGAAQAAEATRKRVLAEARFLRAFSYYNLVRLWGRVPLILTATAPNGNLQVSRNTEDEIYAAIITDLQYAAGETPDNPGLPLIYGGANNGRATIGAANALLAEVYLTRRNWAKAAEYAQKVVASNRYALWPNYTDVFLYVNKYAANSAPNGEAIFEFQYQQDAAVPTFIIRWTGPRDVLFQGLVTGRGGFGSYASPPLFFNSFSPPDARRASIFPETYPNQNGVATRLNTDPRNVYNMKYKLDGQNAPFGNAGNNWPILRLADVLLIQAEALNEASGPTADAYAAINRIRNRARLPNLTTGLSQAAFRDSLYAERSKELFLEGDRWFDLLRTNRLTSELARVGVTVTDAQRFLPIPQSELDLNPNLR